MTSVDRSVSADQPEPGPSPFPATRWSLVLDARSGDEPDRRRALAELCSAYWYPLYAFARRAGRSPEDAEDLTQGFFCKALANGDFGKAEEERGRLRTYLLAGMKHFMASDWEKRHALKRGGRQVIVSIEQESAERRYHDEPAHLDTPDKLFERRWAFTLLERACDRLRNEYKETRKAELFEALREFLIAGAGSRSYAEAGAELGLSEGAVKVAVFRLRKRFQMLFKAEIADTVGSPDEIDDEIAHLYSVFG